VLKHESVYSVEVKDNSKVTPAELRQYISLFENVKGRNFDLNTFDYPTKFFENILQSKQWELIELKLNENSGEPDAGKPVAIAFTYKNSANNYNGVFLGLNYDYSDKYKVYRQVLFQAIKRAKDLGSGKVYLGLSASIEKKKFGARIIPRVAYVQAKDNFNMEFIETITGTSVAKHEENKAA
jgi:hypothetical protein